MQCKLKCNSTHKTEGLNVCYSVLDLPAQPFQTLIRNLRQSHITVCSSSVQQYHVIQSTQVRGNDGTNHESHKLSHSQSYTPRFVSKKHMLTKHHIKEIYFGNITEVRRYIFNIVGKQSLRVRLYAVANRRTILPTIPQFYWKNQASTGHHIWAQFCLHATAVMWEHTLQGFDKCFS